MARVGRKRRRSPARDRNPESFFAEHEIRARRLAHFVVKLGETAHMTDGHAAADDAVVHGDARAGWRDCRRDPCRRIAAVLRDVDAWPYLEGDPTAPEGGGNG